MIANKNEFIKQKAAAPTKWLFNEKPYIIVRLIHTST